MRWKTEEMSGPEDEKGVTLRIFFDSSDIYNQVNISQASNNTTKQKLIWGVVGGGELILNSEQNKINQTT